MSSKQAQVEAKNWTIAYRTDGEPVFHRATDFVGTWHEAEEMSGEVVLRHPEYRSVYYVPTRESELTEFVTREDVLNILVDDVRVPIVDDGTIR